ncbi:molybdenum cofactor biosynthesis protein F [Nocardia panacis]|uniref:Molybdenum cofactor biosynthesis protein F n=1 Tax=Nocardia panacis TaxID=2340916 RepID=A0A3A4KHX1_9NOCA|nr:molybdenum cofactor biosynthesis F family protein [Nocardia panacis]RJO79209.1 molybdenum cofactor biosynthesis protein F [Nocardia panacis]
MRASTFRPDPGSPVPAGWKAMDEFAAGIDANRLPPTDALIGQIWTLRRSDGVDTELRFRTADLVDWTRGAESGSDWYQAIESAAGVYFLDQTFAARPYYSEVHLVHLPSARTIRVSSTIAEQPIPAMPRVTQEFHPGTVDPGDGRTPSGEVPGPTRDLIGWRAVYRYSPNHLYEHLYLSSERYCWQCLIGEQRGHGDVDLATTWKLAPDHYVFTFREFLIPVAATWLYNLDAMRSTGKFFGLGQDGSVRNAPGGAHIAELGRVSYPDGAQPV